MIITITAELIESLRTPKNGFTKRAFNILNGTSGHQVWPPPHNWVDDVIGTDVVVSAEELRQELRTLADKFQRKANAIDAITDFYCGSDYDSEFDHF